MWRPAGDEQGERAWPVGAGLADATGTCGLRLGLGGWSGMGESEIISLRSGMVVVSTLCPCECVFVYVQAADPYRTGGTLTRVLRRRLSSAGLGEIAGFGLETGVILVLVELVLNGPEGEGRLSEVDEEGVATSVRSEGGVDEVAERVGGRGVERLDA